MKITLTSVLIILTFLSFGQVQPKYPNDSAYIFSTLKKSKLTDVDFGDKTNGIERHYRKLSNEWALAWITLWSDKVFIWSCKPYEFDFSYDLLNINYDKTGDSTDIYIPYESGKPWLKIEIRNKDIGNMTTYYPTGQVKEEFSQKQGYYKLYYLNGQVNILRQGEFRYHSRLKNGTQSIFDKNGVIIETTQIKDWKKE
jgi:hypothetical protein